MASGKAVSKYKNKFNKISLYFEIALKSSVLCRDGTDSEKNNALRNDCDKIKFRVGYQLCFDFRNKSLKLLRILFYLTCLCLSLA